MGLLNVAFNQVLLVDLIFHFQHLHKHCINDEKSELNFHQENYIHVFTYQDKKILMTGVQKRMWLWHLRGCQLQWTIYPNALGCWHTLSVHTRKICSTKEQLEESGLSFRWLLVLKCTRSKSDWATWNVPGDSRFRESCWHVRFDLYWNSAWVGFKGLRPWRPGTRSFR